MINYDGDIFEGKWKNGIIEGIGILYQGELI